MTHLLSTAPAATRQPSAAEPAGGRFREPAYQAFWLLRVGFTVAPILFGLEPSLPAPSRFLSLHHHPLDENAAAHTCDVPVASTPELVA